MRILTSVQYTLSACAAFAILAGCNSSAASVTPTEGLGSPQTKLVVLPISGSSVQRAPVGKEVVNGSNGGSKIPTCSPSGRGGGEVSVSESGNATGRYPGTFTDSAGFIARCVDQGVSVNGTFAVTSGANTISGSFSGNGTGGCGDHPWGETCGFFSNNLAYTASLSRGGKVRKQLSGTAAVSIGILNSSNHMNVTLKRI
jgi:hypothetical protein